MHPAGTYIYPFLFPLPSALPSSFVQDCGSVQYSIKGTIDRPWRRDYTCETPFTVRAIMGNNPALTAQWLVSPFVTNFATFTTKLFYCV